MKILLTGATGFLGKQILKLLLSEPGIGSVHVISRTQSTHPDPRVVVHRLDLADPSALWQLELKNPDFVLHLAGLYDFESDYTENYCGNVLPIVHLTHWLKSQAKKAPLLLASTYAVSYGKDHLEETPLSHLPPHSLPYAYTKALAEAAFIGSKLPGAIFRLGVLVGTEREGKIEKIDGPYYLMRFLRDLKNTPLARAPRLPMPIHAGSFLPLVPVDQVARVFLSALAFDPAGPAFALGANGPPIYAVHENSNVPTRELVEDLFREFLPQSKPYFLNRFPTALLGWQAKFTRMPASIFSMTAHSVRLENGNFLRTFPHANLSKFPVIRKSLISGFHRYLGQDT